MQLERRNLALKALMNSRECVWNDDRKRMQAEIVLLEIELRKAKGMQKEDSEFIQFRNNLPKKQHVDKQNMQKEFMEYRMKVEDVTLEKEELMDTFESENAMLVDRNHQLMAEVKAMQIEIQQNKDDYQFQMMALENQRWSQREEKEFCVQRIKELESLVEATEKKWFKVQGESVELTEKLKTMQTQIQQSETDWDLMWNLWRISSGVSRWRKRPASKKSRSSRQWLKPWFGRERGSH